MSDTPHAYEPPAVEPVETDGRPLETAAGGTVTPTVGASKVEELD